MHHLSRFFLAFAVLLASCSTDQEVFSDLEGGLFEMDIPSDNPINPQAAALGEALFFDPILSLDSSISCANCHKPTHAFADDQAISPGVDGALSTRNSPSLLNVGYRPYFMREGGVPTLEMQVLVPLQDENEMHHNVVDAVRRINQTAYKNDFVDIYGDSATAYLLVRALANYERTLIDFDRPIDRFIAGTSRLSAEAYKGGELFYGKAACANCHSGMLFTDFSFANNGTSIQHPEDLGRQRLTNNPDDKYLFMIPSLKHVSQTSPYMHDGSIASLSDVIAQYNAGGSGHEYTDGRIQPLGLSKIEIAQLLAFLETL